MATSAPGKIRKMMTLAMAVVAAIPLPLQVLPARVSVVLLRTPLNVNSVTHATLTFAATHENIQ